MQQQDHYTLLQNWNKSTGSAEHSLEFCLQIKCQYLRFVVNQAKDELLIGSEIFVGVLAFSLFQNLNVLFCFTGLM